MNANPFRKIYLEALKGDQKKLDVDKDKKIEGEDLAKLRASKVKQEEVEQIDEVEKATGDLKDACWKGYTAVGMKMKNGKKVPNCVPTKESAEVPFSGPYTKGPAVVTDKSGAKHSPMSRVKHLARMAAKEAEKKKEVKEEIEQIDELDKKTLASYAQKAASDATDKARESERRASSAKEAEKRAKDPKLAFAKSANQAVQKHEMGKSAEASKKSAKRLSGVVKATSKLAYKEEVENADEGYIPPAKPKLTPSDAVTLGKVAALMAKEKAAQAAKKKEVKEEIDQLDERNKENATKRKMMDASRGARFKAQGNYVPDAEPEHKTPQAHNKAIGRAIRKMSNEEKETSMEFTQEELALIEQFIEIAEKMNMSKASMGDVIKDFKKSDAPQFAGKSMQKRRQMAIAAKLSADREAKKEEVETTLSFRSYLDEIKMADVPGRKITGRGYGTEYYKKEKEKDEKGYDADDEKEPSEKKGRGRPAGSKSGARQKGSTTGKKKSGVEMTGYPLHLPNR